MGGGRPQFVMSLTSHVLNAMRRDDPEVWPTDPKAPIEVSRVREWAKRVLSESIPSSGKYFARKPEDVDLYLVAELVGKAFAKLTMGARVIITREWGGPA